MTAGSLELLVLLQHNVSQLSLISLELLVLLQLDMNQLNNKLVSLLDMFPVVLSPLPC